MPKGPSANLDFLRAVAVLLVLVQHLCRRLHVEQLGWIPTTSLGFFGVLLFFVHTSLVLMYSMQRSGLDGPPLFKEFYLRRAFRIYPLSMLAIAVALALHLESDINGTAGLSFGNEPGKLAMISQLLLVQNLFHVKSIVNVLWSLPFEVQMYLFLPFLFLWTRRKRLLWTLLALWFVSVLAAWAQLHVGALNRVSLLRFVPCFLPGIIAFVVPWGPRWPSYLWPVLLAGIICAFTLQPVLPVAWVLCAILGLLIPLFCEIRNQTICRASSKIATYSYGIYISHQFCIWLALGLLGGYSLWLRIAVLSGSLVLLPVLLYHGIEKPMIQAGVRLTNKYRKQSALAVHAAA
jgi:peptidoglycan/LPS O-acetylase OafA/YrhL